jgi:uncharacterized protein (DUF2164 family)
MPLQLPDPAKTEALASLERWLAEHLDEPVGNITTRALLAFVVEEIGPLLYNQAVADVQERLMSRLQEIDIEVHEDEFPYWPRQRPGTRGKR